MKLKILSVAFSGLLVMATQAADTAEKATNEAAYQKKLETVFQGETLDRNVQVYAKANRVQWNREKAAGGSGVLSGDFAYTRRVTDSSDAFREIGWLTLPPGASIGLHKHVDNEDVYIIVSGTGVFTDSSGKETVVNAGDITIARPGQSHALKNNGSEPLIFLDLIAQTASSQAEDKSK
ncbi:MAG: cupin domain-containing protein [Cardiobacteriaceae bacterium]|nr:cupin domain-containing protein [Cardiobacteriaceae bacterium]